MASNEYHFITEWQVAATREQVYRTLEKAERLPEWWPAVYLDVQILEKGNDKGIGKVVQLHTKGWLPYTLKWQFRVTEAAFPTGYSLEAWGDFVGTGVWRFEELPGTGLCKVTYDWRISAEKPLLRFLSFLLKPIFAANHHWAMKKGEESLKKELINRFPQSP